MLPIQTQGYVVGLAVNVLNTKTSRLLNFFISIMASHYESDSEMYAENLL